MTMRSQPWLYMAPVGVQADYRTELHIASSRAVAIHYDPDVDYLATTSLIDSMAYSILNTRRLVETVGSEADEYVDASTFASGAIMWLMRHSFRADEVFLLRDKEKTEEVPGLAETYELILDEMGIPYTILEGDPGQWPDQVATIMEGYDNL